MSIRDNLDISAYLVLGPENTLGRPVADVVRDALDAGFTIVQVRSKVAGARELMECARSVADVIAAAGKSDTVPLLIDDRLDVALACREAGIKVDGVHVGQSDIPVEVCRKYLGEDSIVGLSAAAHEMRRYIETADTSQVDYLGVGPLHETATKPDCGLDDDGRIITRSLEELAELRRVSPKPIVVGGGVKAADIPALAKTGVDGFFVVSAVAGAEDPYAAAKELVDLWRANA
ncbi:thiamine phosphate synthase [uncultured Enorma sp.]|uniref:thiamine phosphate synthase n=1 Tax=uncultured Enorma sp. TaxID=1714346 RepID=UPI00262D4114|nr:thiamine phosphate synthase [uncultured Enorma sp.]